MAFCGGADDRALVVRVDETEVVYDQFDIRYPKHSHLRPEDLLDPLTRSQRMAIVSEGLVAPVQQAGSSGPSMEFTLDGSALALNWGSTSASELADALVTRSPVDGVRLLDQGFSLIEQFGELREAKRIFTAVVGQPARDNILTFRWVPETSASELIAGMWPTPAPTRFPVESLCSETLLCAHVVGTPSAGALAPLATGSFAPERVSELLDTLGLANSTLLILFAVEQWPNALAAIVNGLPPELRAIYDNTTDVGVAVEDAGQGLAVTVLVRTLPAAAASLVGLVEGRGGGGHPARSPKRGKPVFGVGGLAVYLYAWADEQGGWAILTTQPERVKRHLDSAPEAPRHYKLAIQVADTQKVPGLGDLGIGAMLASARLELYQTGDQVSGSITKLP
ncbi:hypothetical protein [Nannocystis bainbridge]|uniref:Uncharacterized protein n=1 Tax=Nannocystis bainbridge TaxID=2995303 RepID=A0ABT5DW50_9BACT|nr:hypothetical protein [Nannocystis bainbridge]MDC0716943.1 hypothetical protein [Nannocystis bainbridge]